MIDWLRSVIYPRPKDPMLRAVQQIQATHNAVVTETTDRALDVNDRVVRDFRRFDDLFRNRRRTARAR